MKQVSDQNIFNGFDVNTGKVGVLPNQAIEICFITLNGCYFHTIIGVTSSIQLPVKFLCKGKTISDCVVFVGMTIQK